MPRDFRSSRYQPKTSIPPLAIIGVVCVACCMISAGVGILSPGVRKGRNAQQQKQPEEKPVRAPVATVDADELQRDYEANEVAADQAYKGECIEVRGAVDRVGRDILNAPYVTLRMRKQFAVFRVQCVFGRDEEASIAGLAPGHLVRIAGTCKGKFGNVILEGCRMMN